MLSAAAAQPAAPLVPKVTPATPATPAMQVTSATPATPSIHVTPATPAVPAVRGSASTAPVAAAAPRPAVPAVAPVPAVASTATADADRTELGGLISLAASRFNKRFVVDPRVRGSVDVSAFSGDFLTYHAFLEILGVHGFIAVPSGDVVAIIPDAYVRQVASPVMGADQIKGDDAEVVTVIIPVGDVEMVQRLAVTLRQLVPQWGHISATGDQKSLLVVDKVANVKRLVAVVRAQLPQP
jgi:hypothetical protein